MSQKSAARRFFHSSILSKITSTAPGRPRKPTASAVKLTCEELQKSTGGEWVDVCKLPE